MGCVKLRGERAEDSGDDGERSGLAACTASRDGALNNNCCTAAAGAGTFVGWRSIILATDVGFTPVASMGKVALGSLINAL